MKMRLLILTISILFIMKPAASQPKTNFQGASKDCALAPSIDVTKGSPLIYGIPYLVPALELKFVEKATGKSTTPRAVRVHYYWQWLEYPYPEHEWGAWVDGEELMNCTLSGGNVLKVPALLVKPRGWYDGKYTRFPWRKNPHFDRLEIMIDQGGGDFSRIIVHKNDLNRYRVSEATVELSSSPPNVKFDEKR